MGQGGQCLLPGRQLPPRNTTMSANTPPKRLMSENVGPLKFVFLAQTLVSSHCWCRAEEQGQEAESCSGSGSQRTNQKSPTACSASVAVKTILGSRSHLLPPAPRADAGVTGLCQPAQITEETPWTGGFISDAVAEEALDCSAVAGGLAFCFCFAESNHK